MPACSRRGGPLAATLPESSWSVGASWTPVVRSFRERTLRSLRQHREHDRLLSDQLRRAEAAVPLGAGRTGTSRLMGLRIHESVVTPNALNRRTVGYIEQLNRANMLD